MIRPRAGSRSGSGSGGGFRYASAYRGKRSANTAPGSQPRSVQTRSSVNQWSAASSSRWCRASGWSWSRARAASAGMPGAASEGDRTFRRPPRAGPHPVRDPGGSRSGHAPRGPPVPARPRAARAPVSRRRSSTAVRAAPPAVPRARAAASGRREPPSGPPPRKPDEGAEPCRRL